MLQKKDYIFGKVIIKIVKVLCLLYIVAMLIISLDGLKITQHGDNKQAKFAIVYGSKVDQNGVPSERLKARLDTALNLYNAHEVERIIVSGGIGESGFDEAEVMKKYLINKGVKNPRVITDQNGYNTMMTSKNTYDINKQYGNYPHVGVVAVSQFFHLSRAKLSLRRAGFIHIGSMAPDYFELRDIYSLVREVPAYLQYFFSDIGRNLGVSEKDLKEIGDKAVEKLSENIIY